MSAGETIATIEAMKMEAAITAPKAVRWSGSRCRAPRRSKAATCWWCVPGKRATAAQVTRIIGGVAGGRRIAVPAAGNPADDRPGARVAVQHRDRAPATDRLGGAGPLRGFRRAGTGGAVARRGIGAVRGVRPRSAAVIARNIETLGLPGATLRRGAVAAVLAGCAVSGGPGVGGPAVRRRERRDRGGAGRVDRLDAEGTVAVIERAAAGAALAWPDGWEPYGTARVYGDTRLELAERV